MPKVIENRDDDVRVRCFPSCLPKPEIPPIAASSTSRPPSKKSKNRENREEKWNKIKYIDDKHQEIAVRRLSHFNPFPFPSFPIPNWHVSSLTDRRNSSFSFLLLLRFFDSLHLMMASESSFAATGIFEKLQEQIDEDVKIQEVWSLFLYLLIDSCSLLEPRTNPFLDRYRWHTCRLPKRIHCPVVGAKTFRKKRIWGHYNTEQELTVSFFFCNRLSVSLLRNWTTKVCTFKHHHPVFLLGLSSLYSFISLLHLYPSPILAQSERLFQPSPFPILRILLYRMTFDHHRLIMFISNQSENSGRDYRLFCSAMRI